MSRVERDHLGEMELPDNAYYGVQTKRAMINFPVSGLRASKDLVRAYVQIKASAALVNMKLGMLDEARGNAIVMAADDILLGLHADQFPVDVYQAGAGTSLNMNVNEVLANLALQKMGWPSGTYDRLSPNDHVNMGQSTNDTFPTACHIAIDRTAEFLLLVLSDLEAELLAKSVQLADVVKPGRTHLMDALPVTLGQEFGGYAMAVQRARERISRCREDLLELPIGGTAVGTGANSDPQFRGMMIDVLSKGCGRPFRPSRDGFEALQSRSQMVAYSSSLKELAIELIRIANDLRLLSSGPTAGIGEIELPAVQPGSSIMPGKVNPVMAECLNMVCFQVIGNDTAVTMAAQAGQLELNVMTPLMVHNILSSQDMLINYLPVFTARCLVDLTADPDRCRNTMMRGPILATFLNRRIGYLRAADVVDEALRTGEKVPDIAVRKGYLTQEEADQLFDPKAMTVPRYLQEGGG